MTDPSQTLGVLERVLGSSEPIRRALYPVVLAIAGLLVAYGVVDAERVPLWIALAVAVLGPGAVEAARAVAYSPATVDDQTQAWRAELENEYARGVAAGLERTPDRVAHELLDDEPGQHAADRPREDDAATGLIVVPRLQPATTRASRCREVENGRRCALTRDHDGPHHLTTG